MEHIGQQRGPNIARAGKETSPSLRRLASEFPGVDENEDIEAIFNDMLGDKVEFISEEKSTVHFLGGELDYSIEVGRLPSFMQTKGARGQHYFVKSIVPTELKYQIESARQRYQEYEESETGVKKLIMADPEIRQARAQIEARLSRRIFIKL